MKQLIITCAILPIFAVLIMQIGHAQVNMSRLQAMERCIEEAEIEACSEGYFSKEVIDKMHMELAEILNIEENSIEIDATGIAERKYRRDNFSGSSDLLELKINVVYPGVMAGSRLLGIRDEDNCIPITINRYIHSEKLRA